MFFVKKMILPKLTGYSLSLGFCKEYIQKYENGYDREQTHEGYEYYFYTTLLRFNFCIGYKKIRKISQ